MLAVWSPASAWNAYLSQTAVASYHHSVVTWKMPLLTPMCVCPYFILYHFVIHRSVFHRVYLHLNSHKAQMLLNAMRCRCYLQIISIIVSEAASPAM